MRAEDRTQRRNFYLRASEAKIGESGPPGYLPSYLYICI
jgi:hypothetical protein